MQEAAFQIQRSKNSPVKFGKLALKCLAVLIELATNIDKDDIGYENCALVSVITAISICRCLVAVLI